MTDIHDSIPMPNRAERNAYPFGKLVEAGQCFVVECDDIKHERSVRSSATRWNSRHPDRRYVVRRLGKELLDEMIKKGLLPEGGSGNGHLTVGVWRKL
tara:strand:- start:1782 stop:2075 length:294 start_codon:yes stop_codon:yes gene_type:complete